MLAESGLLNLLQENAYSQTGRSMCLYGDAAYPHRVRLQSPYRNAEITPQHAINQQVPSDKFCSIYKRIYLVCYY